MRTVDLRLALRSGPIAGWLRRFDDGRGVAASAFTSLLARFASAATTLVAMPVALHSLGEARFAAFLVLFGVINWLSLGNLGVHTALGRTIAAGGSDVETRSLLGGALLFSGISTSLTALAVLAAFLVWLAGPGAGLGHLSGEVMLSGLLMIGLMTAQIVLQTFEGVQIGRLQMYRTNIARLAGSLFTFAAILALPRFWTSMAVFVLALNGGLLLSAALNARMVLRQVIPSFHTWRRDLARLRQMAVSGLAFVVIGVASLAQTQAPVLILAAQHGAAPAVDFGLLVRLLVTQMVFLSMVTGPLWPAITRARQEADFEWVRRTLVHSAVFVGAVGVGAFLAVAVFGSDLLWLWTGRRLSEGTLFRVAFGVYFLQMAWSHYWAIVLVGLGRERLVAGVLFVEGAILLGLASVAGLGYGPTGVICGMVAAFAGVSGWILPLVAVRLLRDEFGKAHARRAPAAGGLTEASAS